MESKIKHLEMIQAIISRLANNSFLLKGWGVVLVSALFALAAKDSEPLFVYLAFFPAIAFWILDGYYLRQERLFRKYYDAVREKEDSEIDFSMDTSSIKREVKVWFRVCFSRTLLIFYGTMAGVTLLLALVLLQD